MTTLAKDKKPVGAADDGKVIPARGLFGWKREDGTPESEPQAISSLGAQSSSTTR